MTCILASIRQPFFLLFNLAIRSYTRHQALMYCSTQPIRSQPGAAHRQRTRTKR